MPALDLRDFSGGLNLRDSLDQLGANETPDALNMTLTTRGAAEVRAGCQQAVTTPVGAPSFIFYSAVLDRWFVQVGSTIHINSGDLLSGWSSHITLGSSNVVDAAEFAGLVVFCQLGGSQGIWTTNGTAATGRSTVAKGYAIAVYKNRCWVADGALRSRVWFSNLGDPTVWTTASDFVDVKEKDDEVITAFGESSSGLLVFKKRSAYRITDATTGAYSTIDWTSGCVGPRASASLRGIAYTWAPDGIYAWDGIGRGINIGDKIRPRFLENTSSEAAITNIAAGTLADRVLFAYPLNGSVNDRFLELYPADSIRADYYPAAGWIMEHQLAQAGENEITCFASKGAKTYACLGDGAAIYSMLDGTVGHDDLAAFSAYHKTPPLGLGKLSRLQRLRVWGKADAAGTSTKQLRTYKDWSSSVEDTFDITAALETGDQEEVTDLRSLGHAEAFQLEFRCSGGTGAAELNRLLLDLTPLER